MSDWQPEDSTEQADHGIVDVVDDDKSGRKIIVVSACKFPAKKYFDNQRFLRFYIITLEQLVAYSQNSGT